MILWRHSILDESTVEWVDKMVIVMVSLPFLIATASPLLGLWTGAAIGSEDAVSGPESQPAPKDAKMLAEGVPESPAQRLRREGIRALNNGDPERMSAAGLNLALPWERLLLDARKTTPPGL